MGSNANCGEPLCCRANSPNHTSGPPAGAWGDYRLCDTPLQTIENTLKHISNTHKVMIATQCNIYYIQSNVDLLYTVVISLNCQFQVDYILWTGDDPPHNVWNQNKEQHIAVLTKVATLLQAYFPGIPVFPALGNHEGIPVNRYGILCEFCYVK